MSHLSARETPIFLPDVMPTCDDRQVVEVWSSRFYLPTLVMADEMGIFSFLEQSQATAEEAAERFTFDLHGMKIVLGLLTALGFLIQRKGHFSLTDVSRTYLLPESPYYSVDALRALGRLPLTPSSLHETLVKEGDSPLMHAWKAGIMPDEVAERMAASQFAHAWLPAMGVARYGDFHGVSRLLNVAGGPGTVAIALALHYPDMHTTVMELPAMCKQIDHYVSLHGQEDRVDTVGANMFDGPWPSGYDAVLLSNIVHAWDEDASRLFIMRSFEALPAGGRIFVHELLINETRDGSLTAMANSMGAFCFFGNKLLSGGEIEERLREAGFEDIVTISVYTPGSEALIRARKPA